MTVEPIEEPGSRVPEQERMDGGVEAPAGEQPFDPGAEDGAASPGVEEQLRVELSTTRDRLLRAVADLDNQRKRMDRERQQLRTTYVAAPLREFLGVMDNLERALDSEASAEDFRAGVEMIRRQMTDLLRRFDVEPVDSVDAVFDPNVHEAVAREESTEVDRPTVVQELQKGYTMHSRLLRAAMVRVAMPAPPPAADGGSADDVESVEGVGAESDAAAGGGA